MEKIMNKTNKEFDDKQLAIDKHKKKARINARRLKKKRVKYRNSDNHAVLCG
jgi:hypothetical protein